MRAEDRFATLERELARRRLRVQALISSFDRPGMFRPEDIREAVHSYLRSGGKALRAGVLLFSCGAVGGQERWAVPAAAATEVYHAWTLVHDDLIDRDDTRRGGPTVHRRFLEKAHRVLGMPMPLARHYGESIAVLAGDLQQGWVVSLLAGLAATPGVSAATALAIIKDLQFNVQRSLIEGETLDVLYSRMPAASLGERAILRMLELKTGALFGFAGRAGALIGLRETRLDHPQVKALSAFAGRCGVAFQIADDVLGVVGDERKLGKPVGSDIRSGKKTVLVYHALAVTRGKDRSLILKALGSPGVSPTEVARVTRLLVAAGSVDYARRLAHRLISGARRHLRLLPVSRYRDLLETWAEYVVRRDL